MAAIDDFSSNASGLESPARNAIAVTPNDGTDLTHVARALYVGVTGDVTINTPGTGTQVLFKAVPAGTILPVRVQRVWAAGTTATNIVAIY